MGAALCLHPYFWRNADELIFLLRNIVGCVRNHLSRTDTFFGLSDDAHHEAAAAAERDGVHRGGYPHRTVLSRPRAATHHRRDGFSVRHRAGVHRVLDRRIL